MLRRKRIGLLVLAAVMGVAMALLASGPALAHHKDGHDGGTSTEAAGRSADRGSDTGKAGGKGSDHDGDADSDSGTAYTEDNDHNDGNTPNNVSDDGDNAHPSGKDRSVEHGKSGNQGKSESDPDDDGRGPDRTNGGPDKPNGSGGTDKADQDGNNGCGNDDDFEDDNEGWCGGKPKDEETGGTPPCVDDATMPGDQCNPDDTPGDTPDDSPTDEPDDEPDVVLGTRIVKPGPDTLAHRDTTQPAPAAATLPFTGTGIVPFVMVGMALVISGVLTLRSRRS